MNFFENLKKWWDGLSPLCEGCGKPMNGGLFSDMMHVEECINKPLGYSVFSENFDESSRAYFFTEKQRRGL